MKISHDDVIKWKHFPRYWPFVRGIHRSPVNSLHKGRWRGALVFSLICVWTNNWVNNGDSGDVRRNGAHYDVIVMSSRVPRLSDGFSSVPCVCDLHPSLYDKSNEWAQYSRTMIPFLHDVLLQYIYALHSASTGPILHYSDVIMSPMAS